MAKRPASKPRPRGTRTLQEIQTRRAFSGLSKARLRRLLAPAETGQRLKSLERGSHAVLYEAELVDLIARTLGSRDSAVPPASKRTRRRKAPPLRKGEQWYTTTELQRAALEQFGIGLESWHIRSQLDRHAAPVLPRFDFGDGHGTKYASVRATRCLRHARSRARLPYRPYLTSRIRAARTELMQLLTVLDADRGLRESLGHEFDRSVREQSSPLVGFWDQQAPAATVARIDELVDTQLAEFVARMRAASDKGDLAGMLARDEVKAAPAKPAGKGKAARGKPRKGGRKDKRARQVDQLVALLAAQVDAPPGPLLEAIAARMLERGVWDHAEVVAEPQGAAQQLESWFSDIADGSDPRKEPHAAFVEAILQALLPQAPTDATSQDELRRFVVKEIRTRAWAFDCLWHGLAPERRAVERFAARELPSIHAGRISNQLTPPADAKLSPHETGVVLQQMRDRIRQRLEAGDAVPDLATAQDELDQLARATSSTLKRREARKKR